MNSLKTRLVCIALVLLSELAGCTDFSPQARRDKAQGVAEQAGWVRKDLQEQHFTLVTYRPAALARSQSAVLTIYVEGDGLAYSEPGLASDDPTPLHAVALELALRHPAAAVAYLARPCQFQQTLPPQCRQAYWTARRYSPEVVEDMAQAVEQLKAEAMAKQVVLVGYSGGGAIAALVASRRHDVARLVTVAANVDTEAWVRLRQLQPLAGSLNPADQAQMLQSVPQLHFVGGRDRVVDVEVLRAYQSHFPASARPPVREIPDYDHHCCWSQRWPELIGPLLP